MWNIIFVFCLSAFAKEIKTNEVEMTDAPDWLTRGRVERVTDRIHTEMEWTIRKIQVHFYRDEAAFEKKHGLGPNVLAVSMKADNSIHIGPRVDDKNFDGVFGHELVHIISYQKFHGSIPAWLEEGLANHLAKARVVDYHWLRRHPFPPDVRQLTHPFAGTVDDLQYHYVASQALAELLAHKCRDLTELLRLSVQRDMDKDYIGTYCEIHDLNAEYAKWVKKKAGG